MSFEKIYIISPLSAPTDKLIEDNMKAAKRYKRIITKKYHARVFAPHSYLPEELDDNIAEEREIAIRFGQAILNLCDTIAVFTPNVLSRGMKAELLLGHNKTILAENKNVEALIVELFEANDITNYNIQLVNPPNL